MSKRQFKAQASSSRVASGTGFGGFGTTSSGSSLSYLSEPPNISAIGDANVVVAFKNLLKKDSTTKTKGLEDLRTFIQAHPYEQDGGAEQPILEAWVKLYPRVSIDNSRRVRELSHNLQYELLKSARKRMEKFIPSVVGAWLAGTYDRDRTVSRAASDGIGSFLDTEEKIVAFWRKCQSQILAYAQEAILEKPQTLSDDRTVSPDDSQAKYDRVIGASLSLVINLLAKLDDNDIKSHQDSYESFLGDNKTLWSFTKSDDAFVRRISYQLLLISLEKQKEIIKQDLELISNAFIAEGLRTSQSGSSLLFLQALNALTSYFPQAWTSEYKGKKPVLSRLQHFVEKGSQGGPPEYWQLWTSLLVKLPPGILPIDLEGTVDFLKAQREGLSIREEARSNAPSAWSSYFEIVKHLGNGLPDAETYGKLLSKTIYPVFDQYIRPTPENSRWSMGNSTPALARAFGLCASSKNQDIVQSLKYEWQRLADILVQSMLISLPEQSKDHNKSQAAVVGEAHRWFGLQAEILKHDSTQSTLSLLAEPAKLIIKCAIEVLTNRNGKPYGAAATIEAAIRLAPDLVNTDPSTMNGLVLFFEAEYARLITSPSSPYLIASLDLFGTLPKQRQVYELAWHNAINGLLAMPDAPQKLSAITSLVSYHSASTMAQNDSDLQKYILEATSRALRGDVSALQLFENAITYDSMSSKSSLNALSMILELLDVSNSVVESPLHALEFIGQKRPQLLYKEDVSHLTLMTRLLLLTESTNPNTTLRAKALKNIVEGASDTKLAATEKQSPILSIIHENLEAAGPQSLAIDTLVQQAETLLKSHDANAALGIFPRQERWVEALQPLLMQPPNPALAITNIIGGAISLISSGQSPDHAKPQRDLNGFSVAFRMAVYTGRFISAGKGFSDLSTDLQVEYLRLLYLTLELANDQLSLQESNRLWMSPDDPEIEAEVQDFLSSTQTLLVEILADASQWREQSISSQSVSAVVQKLVKRMIQDSAGSSPESFYSARVLGSLLSNLVEVHGWHTSGGDEWLTSLDILKTSTPNILAAAAVLSGLKENVGSSKLVSNYCNRLVSDIAGSSSKSQETPILLIMLNAALSVYEQGKLPVAQNRLVFAVKQITSWMSDDSSMNPSFSAAACRSLFFLLPSIKGVYGSHWELTFDFCSDLWTMQTSSGNLDEILPAIHASLKLSALLRNLEDTNDDLDESIVASSAALSNGLLQLLRLPRTRENQPWHIVDELLCRQVSKIPSKSVEDPLEIYPLIASDFRLIQSAAFDVLHRVTLASAEQLSFDILLEKRVARLPEELLSLLLDAPSIQDYPDDILAQFPPAIRSYLLSWQLIFDSYKNASFKVRNDYSDLLKSENYIGPLLDFLFDVLGHSAASPLNLHSEGFTADQVKTYDYKSAKAETDERDMQWLLVNLYYQCLTYTPGLAKNWWIECKSKQTRIAVEGWTEKFFSPLVILETLDEVEEWATQQELQEDDEKEMFVKVSKKSHEVYAGFEIDELQMQIVIRLPPAYPLESVKVDGVNRVAVSEKKWQSWLIITQGAITFFNGSITDGLSTFRRNVNGALKGQTECAICYSIISSDKKMPDKRCQTCKNLFHSSCLFKWFASSNQSTCPLCRNPFNYGPSDHGAGRGRR